MRTKVLLFLFSLIIVACGGREDGDGSEAVKQKSNRVIPRSGYNYCQFGGFDYDDGKRDIWFAMSSDDIEIDLVIDKTTLPHIPGTGKIIDAYVGHKGNKYEKWEMRSVNYGMYAFRDGEANFEFDGKGWIIYLTFGPIVDDASVIDNVDIKCWIKNEDVVILPHQDLTILL